MVTSYYSFVFSFFFLFFLLDFLLSFQENGNSLATGSVVKLNEIESSKIITVTVIYDDSD